jgi:hypothetical protein
MRPRKVGWALAALAVQFCVAASAGDLPTALLPEPPDTAVRPQDDYYTYINGQWLSQTPIPPQWPWYGVYVAMNEVVQKGLHELIQSAAQKDHSARDGERQVGAMFRSFTDEAQINSASITPLKQELARIDRLRRREDLPVLLARFTRLHTEWNINAQMPATVPWLVGIWPDDRDASHWLMQRRPFPRPIPLRRRLEQLRPFLRALRSERTRSDVSPPLRACNSLVARGYPRGHVHRRQVDASGGALLTAVCATKGHRYLRVRPLLSRRLPKPQWYPCVHPQSPPV